MSEELKIRRATPRGLSKAERDDLEAEHADCRELLQAVLQAIAGTLDRSTEIADHPNVKFAQMQRLQLLAGATPEGWQAEVLQILSTDMQKAIDQWRGDDKVWSGLPILVGIWRDELNRIIKEIRKIRTPDAWQPIGTVPKDGRRVLAWFPRTGDSFAGTPTDDGPWYGPGGEEPTHWRPLPAPPAPASGGH